MKRKPSPFLVQFLILSVILLVSTGIEYLFKPIVPLPSSLVGMIILFILLCLKVVKLHHVEQTGNFLMDNIGLLFVPPGIALVQNWDLMAQYGVIITIIVAITSIILLLGTGWFAQMILGKDSIEEIDRLQKEINKKNEENN